MENEKMQVTVLIDNLAPKRLICEWGLSFHITFRGHNYLLDMGDSGDFAKNAENLNIDLAKVDYAVLSHAHYDHSDGMEVFFSRNDRAPLYIREGTAENCYDLTDAANPKYIGIRKGYLEKYASRIRYAKGDEEVCEDVYLIPHKTPGLEKIGEKVNMKLRIGQNWVTDDFRHEQSLVFRTEKGLVVFNSCSHGGPRAIVHEILDTFPGERLYAYLGGLHQYKASEEEVRDLAHLLKELHVDHLYTGHCTGDAAFAILKEELGDHIRQFCSGFEVTL